MARKPLRRKKEIVNHPVNKETVRKIIEESTVLKSAFKKNSNEKDEWFIDYFVTEKKRVTEEIKRCGDIAKTIEKANNWLNANLSNVEKLAVFIYTTRTAKNKPLYCYPLFASDISNRNLELDSWLASIVENYKDRAKNLLKDKDIWESADHKEYYNLANNIISICGNDLEKSKKIATLIINTNNI